MPMTESLNEAIQNMIEEEHSLIDSNDINNLLLNISKFEPAFYYDRLLCEQFPASDYARLVNEQAGEYNANAEASERVEFEIRKYQDIGNSIQLTNERNTLIKDAIKNNILKYTKKIIYYNDVLKDQHLFKIAELVSHLNEEERREILHNFALTQYSPTPFSYKVCYPSHRELKDVWGIDVNSSDYKIGDYVDEEAILDDYNKERKEVYDAQEIIKKEEFANAYAMQFVNNPYLWEKKALLYADKNKKLLSFTIKKFSKGEKIVFSHLKQKSKATLLKINRKKDKNHTAEDEDIIKALKNAQNQFNTLEFAIHNGNGNTLKIYRYSIKKYSAVYLRDEELTINGKKEIFHVIQSNDEEIYISSMNDDLIEKSTVEFDNSLSRDKVYKYSFLLSPYKTFKDIYDILLSKTANVSVLRRLDRDKVFLIALAFNLDYDTMSALLVDRLGFKRINFKNPYEVTLAYCLIKHTNVCEHYFNLLNSYEEMSQVGPEIGTTSDDTLAYLDRFDNDFTDEDLLNFLTTLPKSRDSKSALDCFKKQFSKVKKIVESRKQEDYLDKYYDAVKKAGDHWSYDAVYAEIMCNPKKRKIYDRQGNLKPNTAINEIIHRYQVHGGNFEEFKSAAFSERNINDILTGKLPVTKEHLIQIYFIEFCLNSPGWFDIVDEYRGDNLLGEIFTRFKLYCNFVFRDCGFSDIYLPNLFERIVVFCLLSKDPIGTFNMILKS